MRGLLELHSKGISLDVDMTSKSPRRQHFDNQLNSIEIKMNNEYEDIVSKNFSRMSTEELVERKERGGLTPSAANLIDVELQKRGIDHQKYMDTLTSVKDEEKQYSVLTNGISERELATPLVRLMAHLIDIIFGLLILFLFIVISDELVWLGVLSYIIYFLFKDALPNGKSLGKYIFRIQTIGLKTNKPCTVMQAFCREITLIIPIIGFVDALMIFGRHHQRLGDSVANTIVIKSR
jgi:uncharacterized RDD family membrane protein YckC